MEKPQDDLQRSRGRKPQRVLFDNTSYVLLRIQLYFKQITLLLFSLLVHYSMVLRFYYLTSVWQFGETKQGHLAVVAFSRTPHQKFQGVFRQGLHSWNLAFRLSRPGREL